MVSTVYTRSLGTYWVRDPPPEILTSAPRPLRSAFAAAIPALNVVGAALLGGAVAGEAIGALHAGGLTSARHHTGSEGDRAAGRSGVTHKGIAA